MAPDYVLVERNVHDKLVAELVKQVERQFGTTPLENADYGKIVNQKHFERLCGLIDESKVVHGGARDA